MRSATRLGGGYWRLLGATGVSNLGDGVLLAALPLLAARATEEPLSVGLVSTCFTLPWLFLGLHAGAVVDRIDPRRLMVITDTARAALVAALTVVAAVGDVRIWMLWLLAAGLGAGEVVFDSASQALVASLAPAEHLERANGWRHTAELVGGTFFGLPAGALLFAGEVWLPFGVDAVSFVVAVLLVAGIPRRLQARRPPPVTGARRPMRAEIAEGFRWLRGHAMLRALTVALTLSNLAFAMVESTFVLYLTRELDLPPRWFGAAVAAMGAGGVVAGLVTGRLVDRFGRRATVVLSALAPVLAMALLGTARSWPLAVGIATAQAAVVTTWSIVAVSIRQQWVPTELFGRVNGVHRWASWGAMPLGAAIGGLAASLVGLRVPYIVAVALLVVAAVVVLRAVAPHLEGRNG